MGSELTLELIKPPDSELISLRIKLCNAYPKKIYEVTFLFSSGEVDTSYHTQRKTEKIISNEWLKYYRDRTRIQFLKHREVDMSTLVSPGSTSESEDIYSPRTWLHRHLSLPLARRSDSEESCDSSPRHWLGKRSSLTNSRESSPRDVISPRKGHKMPL